MKKGKVPGRCMAWVLCALWMAFIYMMSATPGDVSGAESGLLTDIALRVFSFLFGSEAAARVDVGMLEFLIRKAAHMTEYAILFILWHRALRLSGARRPALWAFAVCVLYAAGDEFHQSFTPERGPSPVDVAIDSAGAGAALLLTKAYLHVKNRACGRDEKN